MTDTPVVDWVTDVQPPSLAERVAMPFFLFGAFLCMALGFSWLFVLPRWSTVEIAGKSYGEAQLQSYEQSLRASVVSLERERDASLYPHDAVHAELQAQKSHAVPLAAVVRQIQEQARALSAVPNAVHIDHTAFQAEGKMIVLTGDVRSVGPSSMTVLAQFAEQLSKMSFVDSMAQPTFVRQDDPALGPHSPFRITLTLK